MLMLLVSNLIGPVVRARVFRVCGLLGRVVGFVFFVFGLHPPAPLEGALGETESSPLEGLGDTSPVAGVRGRVAAPGSVSVMFNSIYRYVFGSSPFRGVSVAGGVRTGVLLDLPVRTDTSNVVRLFGVSGGFGGLGDPRYGCLRLIAGYVKPALDFAEAVFEIVDSGYHVEHDRAQESCVFRVESFNFLSHVLPPKDFYRRGYFTIYG